MDFDRVTSLSLQPIYDGITSEVSKLNDNVFGLLMDIVCDDTPELRSLYETIGKDIYDIICFLCQYSRKPILEELALYQKNPYGYTKEILQPLVNYHLQYCVNLDILRELYYKFYNINQMFEQDTFKFDEELFI